MTSATFGVQARHLHSDLRRTGSNLHDMRSSDSLELRLGVDLGVESAVDRDSGTDFRFEWIESHQPFTRSVPTVNDPSQIAFFLDGSQRTLPGYHCSAIPILASVTAAGILERKSPVELQIMPGMIALNRSWLAPMRTSSSDVQRFVELVGEIGHQLVDPLNDVLEPDYSANLSDYAHMEQRALVASREIRVRLETDLLNRWLHRDGPHDAWMIADGVLHGASRNVIGLVKSFTRQYVPGEHADQLFRLPAGRRSSAFVVEDKWRPGAYAVWYLRLRDAAGRDPRHSLVRIETADPELTSEQVDTLSAWVLSERTPRATADSRWATLLYPIHYLERILKRYIDNETRYWPGAGVHS